MATKKRQYVRDLIKVTADDRAKALEDAGGSYYSAFGSFTSCPIAHSLKRHGYKNVHLGKFSTNPNNVEGFQTLSIGRKKYKMPPRIEDWQRRGSEGQRTRQFQFRISELETIN